MWKSVLDQFVPGGSSMKLIVFAHVITESNSSACFIRSLKCQNHCREKKTVRDACRPCDCSIQTFISTWCFAFCKWKEGREREWDRLLKLASNGRLIPAVITWWVRPVKVCIFCLFDILATFFYCLILTSEFLLQQLCRCINNIYDVEWRTTLMFGTKPKSKTSRHEAALSCEKRLGCVIYVRSSSCFIAHNMT